MLLYPKYLVIWCIENILWLIFSFLKIYWKFLSDLLAIYIAYLEVFLLSFCGKKNSSVFVQVYLYETMQERNKVFNQNIWVNIIFLLGR